MTHRILIGIDPGLTGALAVLCDGDSPSLFDMPKMRRRTKGEQVNAAELASVLRHVRTTHPGAAFLAVMESVAARPGQGVSSMFAFGQAVGVVRGVVAALGFPMVEVSPQKWKAALNLTCTAKDYARTRALELYPGACSALARKRDGGRADALLIATWAHRAEVGG